MPSAPASLSSIVLHDVSFAWPDGTPVLDHLNAAFSSGVRTGIVGPNGAGKSTLLHLIAGRSTPTGGRIVVRGSVDLLPQGVAHSARATLADLLGVRTRVDAVRAIEAGDVRPHLFDLVGDDWDVAERAGAELHLLGLPTDLDGRVGALSGGEATLAALAGVRLRRAAVALLDEPSNNLDARARDRLAEVIRTWRGTLLFVSHDPLILQLADATAELRAGALSLFTGPHADFLAHVEAEQEAARRALRAADQVWKAERRQRAKAEQRIAHSERQARKDETNRRHLPAVADRRRNDAQKAQGRARRVLDTKVADARGAREQAAALIRDEVGPRWDLPDPGLARGRRIATLTGADGRAFVLAGPERAGLTGPNGVGKTTLVEALVGRGGPPPDARPRATAVAHTTRIGYLPQRAEPFDSRSAVDVLRAVAPGVPDGWLRDRLARLGIAGEAALRPVETLSGGERFRVTLARLVWAAPPSELLVLDEPTNDLDPAGRERLIEALVAHRGALVVASHDRDFLSRLRLDVEVVLDEDGRLTQVAP